MHLIVISALFFISLFAVSFPAVSKQLPFIRIPHLVFFIGKHFGTGAILSTAFCHLLPDTFSSLQDSELQKWAGHIILGSLLTIFLVEYISTSYVDHLHSQPSVPPSPSGESPPPTNSPSRASSIPSSPAPASSVSPVSSERTPLLKRTKSLCDLQQHHQEPDHDTLLSLILLNSSRLARGGPGFSHSGLWDTDISACACQLASRVVDAQAHHPFGAPDSNARDENRVHDLHSSQGKVGRKRQVVGILVLQLGIMIHSLVIGLTLAITTGTDFTSLVTAIVFHQLFEGLSLGIRIAGLPPSPSSSQFPPSLPLHSPQTKQALHLDKSRWQSTFRWLTQHWLAPTLSLLFALTTPLGMVLGALVFSPLPNKGHDVVTDPNQIARMHLTQGLMSGMSAGMLVYAATVEMLGGDFVFGDVGAVDSHVEDEQGQEHHHHHHHHGQSHSRTSIKRKALAVASLLAGAVTMAVVGLGE